MSTQFFGQFLLAQGAVTPAQLDAAIAFQRSRNPRLGELAVARGWLTEAQAQAINAEQRRADRQFGVLAQEMGLLSEAQVVELLAVQAREHVRLGEALVQQGIVPAQDMAYWLEDFEHQRGRFAAEVERFLGEVHHGELVSPAVELGTTLFLRLLHLPALIHACAIGGVRWPPHPYGMTLRFQGDVSGSLSLTLTEPLLAHMASKMAQTPLDVTDPLCAEAAAEFLYVLSGNWVGRLQTAGIALKASPPMPAAPVIDDRAVVVTFATPLGDASLAVLVDERA